MPSVPQSTTSLLQYCCSAFLPFLFPKGEIGSLISSNCSKKTPSKTQENLVSAGLLHAAQFPVSKIWIVCLSYSFLNVAPRDSMMMAVLGAKH
mmetsp:Transcript_31610/g.61672  ORF Transcript_31610/g.61672 Transcript_31610/m.61672 type:complete len:93 (+) Transcript_31610:101-379(+)